jgi:hypothetical protein
MFRTISQTAVNYRKSSLSVGRAGAVHGGDRLPWVKGDLNGVGGNFMSLTSLDWQVHVHGVATHEIQAVCNDRKLPLHVFPWRQEMSRPGLRRNAVYLVRPGRSCGQSNDDHVLSRRACAYSGEVDRSSHLEGWQRKIQTGTCKVECPPVSRVRTPLGSRPRRTWVACVDARRHGIFSFKLILQPGVLDGEGKRREQQMEQQKMRQS